MYMGNPGLDYVSFEIGSGKIVGLLGPNGAGKTISMIILTGYLAYESGEVEILYRRQSLR